jgi:AraC-like DNA-binding protein
MIVSILDLINIIALFQLSVFTLFLFLKKEHRQSNLLLAVFLIAQILIIFNFECFNFYREVYTFCPHLFYLGLPFLFLAAPVFYLYVKSLAFSDFRFNRRHLIHAAPFVVVMLLFVFTFHIHSTQTIRTMLDNRSYFISTYRWYYSLIVHLYILLYNISSLMVLNNYRRKIKETCSSVEKINLSWLSFVLYGFLFACCSSIISFLTSSIDSAVEGTVVFINFLIFFIFFNFIFFKALVQPVIFSGVKEASDLKRPFLSKSLERKYLDRLKLFMETEKPFLKPDITIFELSRKISVSSRALSEVINKSLGQNFYDFINSYRIKESQRLLSDNTRSKKTVLEVLYEVGYNSKSSFNIAFKKHTGMTPSQFKKRL